MPGPHRPRLHLPSAPRSLCVKTRVSNAPSLTERRLTRPSPNSPRYRFRPGVVKEMMDEIIKERLTGVEYEADTCSMLARDISDEIKFKLKELGFEEQYKFVVQVVIGEEKGEGVRMGCRCFWDPKTDNHVATQFHNATIFCAAAAFGIWLY